MKTKLMFLLAGVFCAMSCGVKNPLPKDDTAYTYCDTPNNFCIRYPRAVFPPPQKGDKADDLVLGLYSEEYDIRLFLSADKNAENLTFEQLYGRQVDLWKSTYDDVDEESSTIGERDFEASAIADGYHLYAKTVDLGGTGRLVTLRLVAGPEVNALFFDDLKKNILLYLNK